LVAVETVSRLPVSLRRLGLRGRTRDVLPQPRIERRFVVIALQLAGDVTELVEARIVFDESVLFVLAPEP
jgi:hypothetical protein